jgi:hypothetical protein
MEPQEMAERMPVTAHNKNNNNQHMLTLKKVGFWLALRMHPQNRSAREWLKNEKHTL